LRAEAYLQVPKEDIRPLSHDLKGTHHDLKGRHHAAREASWRRAFDPCTPLLFDLYHYLDQNGYFGLVPEKLILSELGSILVDGFDTRLIP